MKHILFYILFLTSLVVFPQAEEKTVPYDESTIRPKSFDTEKINTYQSNKDFIYVIEKREPTWIEFFWEWLKRIIKNLLSYLFDDIEPAVGFLRAILRVLPYIIAVIVLYLIIKFFLKVNAQNIIDGKSATPIVHLSEDEELIRDKDLSKLIERAISEGNYRLAIRYYYLLILKKLSEKELISWKQEKTNEDYIQELKTSTLTTDFKEITYLYDYVWYGNFFIDKNKFLQSEIQLKKFLNAI